MKMFTKLALVSSMAISANAMAMQSMDDAALSAATGQDGINIGIGLGTNADLSTFTGVANSKGILINKLYVHDNGGLSATAAFNGTNLGGKATSGAITIDGIGISQTGTGNLLDLVIDSDAGVTPTPTAASTSAFLNIGAKVGAVNVKIGSIGVAASATSAAPTITSSTADVRRGVVASTTNEIITGLNLSLGAIDANIQLGATPQGSMILVKSSLSGLDITNLGIKDNAAGGVIQLDGIHVRGAGGTAIDVDLGIKVKTAGLEITNNSTAGNDVYVKGIHLGTAAAASIGDVEIQGLKMGQSTITISGH
ncbi:putative pilus system protein FilA [Acinetobacter beijerinckii]|uniref:putative pilus system protein FilA n=1 Tax=Acinetobacter beijerinckii TaxID=262668 RepID=UPI00145C63F2|nr:protein FilA [Acinetobacter baumannii]